MPWRWGPYYALEVGVQVGLVLVCDEFSRERRANGSCCVRLQLGSSCLSRWGCRCVAGALRVRCRCVAGALPGRCGTIENLSFPKENQGFCTWAGALAWPSHGRGPAWEHPASCVCRQDICCVCRQDICCVSRQDICCVSRQDICGLPRHPLFISHTGAAAKRPPLCGQCLGDVLGDRRCLFCSHNRCLVC